MTVPFVWDEHEQPYDFARYSSYGIRSILEKHGFEIIEQRKSANDLRVIFQLINTYLYKIIMKRNRRLSLIICLLFTAIFNVMGFVLAKVTPKNNDLYLDNIILARKIHESI